MDTSEPIMKTTPGSKVYLKLSGESRQWHTVVFAGPQSLRLKRGDGTLVGVSRNKVRRRLGISASPGARLISTPMGGKPRSI
jgi:hypothetical protein